MLTLHAIAGSRLFWMVSMTLPLEPAMNIHKHREIP